MVVVEGIESKGEAMVLSRNKVGAAQDSNYAAHSTNDSLYHLRSERIWKKMYFVDRQKIEQILGFLEKQLGLFEGHDNWDGDLSELIAERLIQTSIDSVLDVGNAVIDGFIMRDPGSYEDIIDILQDEKVISEEKAIQFKKVLPLRKMLVQDFIEVNHTELHAVFSENIEAFQQFPDLVRNYLTNELGPVSAFKN
ncbi:DUF86 domain-containing protein [Peribacillus simplex]|uniref:DUF86 domain-containing protein n=1 Tax=Peribacillus simplex TaxID=1478 RepID=UPI00288C4291|nr:DUF86 domain-containing protein [Peribacillus simplex]